MQESACLGKSESIALRSECLLIGELPAQSELLFDYLNEPTSLRKFYPSAIRNHSELADRVPDVLSAYTTDRGTLCEILDRQNTVFGSFPKVSENIERLRSADSV